MSKKHKPLRWIGGRALLAEWWELRWRKKGHPDVLVDSGFSASGLRPAGTYGSSRAAHKIKRRESNRYHVVVHVRRYIID